MTISIPILLLLSQAVWAASYVALKYSLAEISPAGIIFLRFGFASLAFLVYWCFRHPPRFSLKDLIAMSAIGTLTFFVGQVLQTVALSYTQAIDASIMIAFEPLITVLAAAILVKEHTTKRTWVALAVGTTGMFFLSKNAQGIAAEISAQRLFGNLLFLGSLMAEAICSVSGKVYANRYGAIHSIAVMMMAGFVVGSIVNFSTIASIPYAALSLRAWGSVLVLGLGCSVFCYSLWYYVIRRAPIQQAALSLLLQPVLGTFLGFFVLGESIGVWTIVGAGMIISSLIWWQLRS